MLRISEPTIYSNAYYGDGNLPIVYSNVHCRGYETSVLECAKESYGEFSCASRNVVGVACQDGVFIVAKPCTQIQ